MRISIQMTVTLPTLPNALGQAKRASINTLMKNLPMRLFGAYTEKGVTKENLAKFKNKHNEFRDYDKVFKDDGVYVIAFDKEHLSGFEFLESPYEVFVKAGENKVIIRVKSYRSSSNEREITHHLHFIIDSENQGWINSFILTQVFPYTRNEIEQPRRVMAYVAGGSIHTRYVEYPNVEVHIQHPKITRKNREDMEGMLGIFINQKI